jgi:hypothetical protein
MLELEGRDSRAPIDPRSKQDAMDCQEMREGSETLVELRADLERAKSENDTVTADLLQQQIDALTRSMRQSRFRDKVLDLNSRLSKLRPKFHGRLQAVYKAMRNANPPMNKLADHLEAHITSEGSDFVYRPAGMAIPWRFEHPPQK